MDYYKICIIAFPPEEWLYDLIMARLADNGFESFTEADSGFEAFIPADLYNENAVSNILEEYKGRFSFSVEKTLIKCENWNSEWEDNYFKPIVVANECLIRSPVHKDYPQCRFEIVIDPCMSFGTGTHETTAMMIGAMLKNDIKAKSVLDVGCGTGVLGILTSLMEASSVTAVDIDARAVRTAQKNAVLNNIKNINVLKGDISVVKNNRYDVILANIFKNILIKDMQTYYQILNDKGLLFISGFFEEEMPAVMNEAEKWGFKENEKIVKNNWAAIIFKKETC
jgi:ribosomal protein L11 methyltransferase